jgi:hypothetical protein
MLSTLKMFYDERVNARSVVATSGAGYRRLAIENLDAYEACGMTYPSSCFHVRTKEYSFHHFKRRQRFPRCRNGDGPGDTYDSFSHDDFPSSIDAGSVKFGPSACPLQIKGWLPKPHRSATMIRDAQVATHERGAQVVQW